MLPSREIQDVSSPRHVKRPMNCFMVWSKEKRCEILKNNPGINNAEVSKALGVAWRRLSAQEKKPYVDKARLLSEKHLVENPNYKYQPKRRKEVSVAENKKKTRKNAPYRTIKYEQESQESTSTMFHQPSSLADFPQSFSQRSKSFGMSVDIGSQTGGPQLSPDFQTPRPTSPPSLYSLDREFLTRKRYNAVLRHEEFANTCGTIQEDRCSSAVYMPAQLIPRLSEMAHPLPSSPCRCRFLFPMAHSPHPLHPHWHQSTPPGYSAIADGNAIHFSSRARPPFSCTNGMGGFCPHEIKDPNLENAFYSQSWKSDVE